MDAILLIGNNIFILKSIKASLRNSFSIKDLGDATYILGIRMYNDKSKSLIRLNQDTYIDNVLSGLTCKISRMISCPCHMAIVLANVSIFRHMMSETELVKFHMFLLLNLPYMPCFVHVQICRML